MNNDHRICLACGSAVKGRQDKKFCNDFCRNNYNNRQNSDATSCIRNINNLLRRNRRILQQFLNEKDRTVLVPLAKLAAEGFNFTHFTHTYTNPQEKVYYYCYDYGYMQEKPQLFKIVRDTLSPDMPDNGSRPAKEKPAENTQLRKLAGMP